MATILLLTLLLVYLSPAESVSVPAPVVAIVETPKYWYLREDTLVLTYMRAPVAGICIEKESVECVQFANALNQVIASMGAPTLPLGNDQSLSDRPFIRVKKASEFLIEKVGRDIVVSLGEQQEAQAVSAFMQHVERRDVEVVFVFAK